MPFKIRSIYVLDTEWKEFLEICKREGESGSQKLRDYMRNYNQIHRIGNPQRLLESYGSELTLICVYCGKGGFKTLRPVKTPGGEMSVCPDCYKDLEERRLIKK